MADEKKDDKDKKDGDKKEKKEGGHGWEISGGAIIFFTILLMLATLHYQKVGAPSIWNLFHAPSYSSKIVSAWRELKGAYIIFANIFCLIFLIGFMYAILKMREVEKIWHEQIYPIPIAEDATGPKNEKWERVLVHIASTNPSDWRLAILEADIILDELLDHLGYIGDSISDKLKKATTGDFKTLQSAWEAHKIRNAIAHEGQDFILSEREAARIISLYQSVFSEFDYI